MHVPDGIMLDVPDTNSSLAITVIANQSGLRIWYRVHRVPTAVSRNVQGMYESGALQTE